MRHLRTIQKGVHHRQLLYKMFFKVCAFAAAAAAAGAGDYRSALPAPSRAPVANMLNLQGAVEGLQSPIDKKLASTVDW